MPSAKFTILTAVVSLTLGVACSGGSDAASRETTDFSTVDTAAVRLALDSAEARIDSALIRGDMADVVAQFAEDYVSLEQPGELRRGRAAYRAMLDTMAQRGKWHAIDYRADGLDISGDLAVRYGRFSMTFAPTGKDTASEGGNYMHVWRRQDDGSWRVIRDISNYAPPRPVASAERVRE